VSAKPVHDSQEIARLEALVSDVTDRREVEAKYRMLLEHSSDAVLVFDEEGHFLEVNPRLCRLLGYEREELLGMNVLDLLPEEELARLPVSYDDLRAGKTVRRERRLRRKDGTHVRVEVVGSMVAEGKMQSVVRVSLLKEMAAALSTAAGFPEGDAGAAGIPDSGGGIEFYEEVGRFEAGLIRRALAQTRGNQKKAADLLGVNHTTLHAMMRRHGIDPSEFKTPSDFPRLIRDSRPRRK
jgi:PAS domain S-box-containing protein